MPPSTSTQTEAKRLQRITELLDRLASNTDLRAACLLGLTDDTTPHPVERLARGGLKLNAGATTRQLLEYAAPRLGKKRIDRELRDEVWPRLRELGVVQRASVLTAAEAKAEEREIEYGVHRVAKSPNNSYALSDEARELLVETSDADWADALESFVNDDPNRRLRVIQAESAVVSGTSDHSLLIRTAADALVQTMLSEYELVFIDDADDERVNEEWKAPLESRNLLPDLESLWPDAILVRDTDRSIWFIDAVTSDGEIDATRHNELDEWARARGYEPRGYTTAYATWKRTAERQGKMKNLAVGSTIWIAEDGGKLFSIESLAN